MQSVTVTAVLLFFSTTVVGQGLGRWQIALQPAVSWARFPNGVGVGYAPAPFFSGNLKVEERIVYGYTASAWSVRQSRLKNIQVHYGLEFISLGAFQHLDYDYANSFNNIISIEKRYNYVSGEARVQYTIPLSNIQSVLAVGVHIGNLVKSVERNTNYGDPENRSYRANTIGEEKRFNGGHLIGIGFQKGQYTVSVNYRSFWYTHYNHQNKRVVMAGVEIAYRLKPKKDD